MHRHFVRADKGRYLPKYVRMLSVSHDRASDPPAMPGSRRRQVSLALSALAIVYGDIGTSPLYAVRQALTGLEPSADNRGEGGILALLALLSPWRGVRTRLKTVQIALGVFGACLLYGDGMITPFVVPITADKAHLERERNDADRSRLYAGAPIGQRS